MWEHPPCHQYVENKEKEIFMSNTIDLNINDLISCIKKLSKTKDLKNLIESYSDPSVWSIIYNKRNGTADELAYSRFLAWLLHPKENHGLDNKFANQLIIYLKGKLTCSEKELLLPKAKKPKNKEPAYCKTEALGQSIDILYRNDDIGRAIIIENKTGTELHLSNNGQETRAGNTEGKYCQLEKYYNVVSGKWDDSCKNSIKITKPYIKEANAIKDLPKIYIFLHPEGITPAESIERNDKVLKKVEEINPDWKNSDWINPWISISYDDINKVLSKLLKTEKKIKNNTKSRIEEFIVDSRRQFDKCLKEKVDNLIFGVKTGDVDKDARRKDTGVLLSEIMAAIKILDIDIIEDKLDGAYKEVNDKLDGINLDTFKRDLYAKIDNKANNINEEQVKNVIMYLWTLKPKVQQNHPEVQELIRRLFDFFTNEEWSEESENWKKIKPGCIKKIRDKYKDENGDEQEFANLGVAYIFITGGKGQGIEIFTNESTNATEKNYKHLKKYAAVLERYYISGDVHGDVPNDLGFLKKEDKKITGETKTEIRNILETKKASYWLKGNFNEFTKQVIKALDPEKRYEGFKQGNPNTPSNKST